MIENIDLNNFELTSNYVLVKLDSNYDFIEITRFDGVKVELQLVDFTMNEASLQAITGTILAVPKFLTYNGFIKNHTKGITIAGDEYESLMGASTQQDTKLNVKPGDKVTFDYKEALDAEDSGRLVKIDGIGYAVLMHYDALFCKEINSEFFPLNGWVFFKRDQKPNEHLLENGLLVIEKTDKYGSKYATVLCADSPVNDYMDRTQHEPIIDLNPEQRIVLQKGFGFRIAVDRFAGDLKTVECVRRTKIAALLN